MAVKTGLLGAGSFYSDLPQVETVGVTLQYDMGAPLHSPIWLDGYQFFQVTFHLRPHMLSLHNVSVGVCVYVCNQAHCKGTIVSQHLTSIMTVLLIWLWS